ncbi:MAG: tRNA (5-methylaminomethyl-2-thiouridine)(34)-methyltransferase MnmD [Bacteroidota bacterium]
MISLIETQDGSHSILSERFGVTYHSKYGAIQESQHVFLGAGLNVVMPKLDQVRIFEMGFGSGLNAYLSLLAAQKANKSIYYEAVEAFPISIEEAKQLNYAQQLDEDASLLEALHQAQWGEEISITPNFQLLKWQQTLEEATLKGGYDVVFYDAFGPRTQPELWEREPFQQLYDAMNTDGVLVTYCAKGVFKRNLKDIGFKVEGLPGPPGKREMTRAFKS